MPAAITLRLWGVRGSIPSPGPATARHGGNTSCVTLELPGDKVLVLDAGSGIRLAGKALAARRDVPLYVLLTHDHWDHVQGFPFFDPIYQPGRQIYMFPTRHGADALCSLVEQMDGAHFPVTPDHLASRNRCINEDSMQFLGAHGFPIRRIATNHPGGCFGYRVDLGGRSVVYIPDNELHPPGTVTTTLEQLAEFCRGADVLMHDAQYLPDDMPHKRGWGHSLVSDACALAAAAAVKTLLLFHHDPDRSDEALEKIEADAQAWFREHAPATKCVAAREGMVFEL